MKAGNDPGPVVGAILYLLVGPIIWAIHLVAAYGPQSALCAFRVTGEAAVDPWLVSAFVGVVTALSAVAILLVLWLPQPTARLFGAAGFLAGEHRAFLISVTRLLAALSLVGVVLAGATALILGPCAQFR